MYSYGPPHMAVQKQDDQHEHTISSCVRIRDVVLRTCLGRWTIGRSGDRGSGISVLPARHDDDDIYIYIDRRGENVPTLFLFDFFYRFTLPLVYFHSIYLPTSTSQLILFRYSHVNQLCSSFCAKRLKTIRTRNSVRSEVHFGYCFFFFSFVSVGNC